MKGRDDLESELFRRGKRFLQLQGVLVKKYEGLAQYLKDPPMDFYDPDMADWPGVWHPYTVRLVCSRFKNSIKLRNLLGSWQNHY